MSAATVKQKAALWVGIVFVLGASLGGVLGYMLASQTAGASNAQLSDAARRVQKVETLTRELSLTPEQQKQLDTIIGNTQAQFKAIHDSTQPQIEETRKNARAQIRSFLTPEQLPKFEEHLRKMDEERKKNGGR